MKGKKETLARFLYLSRLVHLSRAIGRKLLVLNYHRIKPDDEHFSTPFDDDVFSLSVSEFRRQILWMKRHDLLISEGEIIQAIGTTTKPSGLSILITLDDGYIDSYTRAYPILKELGVPAILFIPTQLTCTRKLGCWDIIAYITKKCERAHVYFEGRDWIFEKRGLWQKVTALNRTLNGDTQKIDLFLDRLAESCGVSLPTPEAQNRELLTWDQIREMASDKISIGSHCHTHPVLSRMDRDLQEFEMMTSKNILGKETGKTIRSIAFPFGGYQDYTDTTVRLVGKCGYRLGFSFNTGVNDWKDLSPFDIRRVAPPGGIMMLSGLAAFPRIFTWKRVPHPVPDEIASLGTDTS
jgi:peptidoglycan/xylan/chitin deacetylase (PgdA/CDA1 family)